ncbi:MAG: hypothetical protein JWO50_594 [Candidatus Kaiserbacteria bacterium]|nr:hypothetical protein [Candidatus Kaiserbacteria bacterium]
MSDTRTRLKIRKIAIPVIVDIGRDWKQLVRAMAPETGSEVPQELISKDIVPARKVLLVNFGEDTFNNIGEDHYQSWHVAWGRKNGLRPATDREVMSTGSADLESDLGSEPVAIVLFQVETWGNMPFGRTFQFAGGRRRLHSELLLLGMYPSSWWFPYVREA